MIPHKAFFFWDKNTPLSYLRFLTIKSFRHFHPNWELKLYIGEPERYEVWVTREKQDFMEYKGEDYIDHCSSLNVGIVSYEDHKDVAPNFMSDFFRWEILDEYGGWYLDLDQIVVKPFDDLCDYDFISSDDMHYYLGCVGASLNSKVPKFMKNKQKKNFNVREYVSIGPKLFNRVNKGSDDLKKIKNSEKYFIGHHSLFYPINISDNAVVSLKKKFPIPRSTYAIHWFGGHPISQKFNIEYTPEFAKRSGDTISNFIRLNGII